ncbi:MAG: hypothetical protein JJ920_05610 [Roseitalea sp.]|jgi:hypothetical protein|nr:hypothetical protein [Roseitalea sp.]MBO6722304.1 hypothetical protein [Roseitalea sp.]MBO6742366.1 hypothetical protein [Roseitalea sp.]
MSYRLTSSLTALIFLALCLVLIFVPQLIYWLFGLAGNTVSDFLAKRAAFLFLGLAVLCFAARNTHSTEVRGVVSLAVLASMGSMALLGMLELWRGHAGPGILVAIAAEVALCAAHGRFAVVRRDHADGDRRAAD